MSFRCPNCGNRIHTLPDTNRARAAMRLGAAQTQPRPARASPTPRADPPAVPADQAAAVRHEIYKRHGGDVVGAAAEWANWLKQSKRGAPA